MGNPTNLRIVILDEVLEHWDHPEVSGLFTRAVGLKVAGFRHAYGTGVLPVDTLDFYGTHLLICREDPREGLIPLSGCKVVTDSRCRAYCQEFPGLTLVKSAGTPDHVAAVEEILERCARQKRELAYTGSWTILPELRQDRALRIEIHKIFEGMFARFHMEQGNAESIVGGTLRFGIEKVTANWGHHPLAMNGRTLDPIHVKHLKGEGVQLMHLTEFSDYSKQLAWRITRLWSSRLELSGRELEKRLPSKKAA